MTTYEDIAVTIAFFLLGLLGLMWSIQRDSWADAGMSALFFTLAAWGLWTTTTGANK